jgi:hypothetical protein
MIISISGLIGSGKDTIADFLVDNYNFQRESFASSLKDAVASVFNWDRTLLEGRTPEAREWRETVDQWWADRLGISTLTPRWVLQYWGTEVLRRNFNDNIWVASLENKLLKSNGSIVITDCRFPNEATALKNAGGILIRVKRGEDPNWFIDARDYPQIMSVKYPSVHASEYSWAPIKFDYVVENDGTKEDLFASIRNLVEGRLASN